MTALLAALLLLPGCGNTDENPTPAAVHIVRGEVFQLPDGTPTSEFLVTHEAIPDWVNPLGKVGMATMTMSFPLAQDVTTDDLAKGDKIEMTVENFAGVDNAPVAYRITQIKKLPADTVLDLTVDPDSDPHDHHHHHGHDHSHHDHDH
ncbi:MAG: copper-binding protein [Planctomycetota bacterium]